MQAQMDANDVQFEGMIRGNDLPCPPPFFYLIYYLGLGLALALALGLGLGLGLAPMSSY